MGGLLVSYRHRGGLRGAPSIEGGMASGCEGSIMESCTGTTLGALWWPEGDGVLAPRVLAMADLEKVERGWSVRVGLGFRRRSLEIPLKMVLWFGSILHLMRVFVEQMTSVKWNLAI